MYCGLSVDVHSSNLHFSRVSVLNLFESLLYASVY